MRSLQESPTVEVLTACLLVFLGQRTLGVLVGDLTPLLAVATPLGQFPWTILTSVYAHASLSHLLGNAILLGLLGVIVEQHTSRTRFHAFIVGTGSLAGIVEAVVTGAAVLGASGAAYALVGYVLAGNRLTGGLVDSAGIQPRWQLILIVTVAVVIALLTYTPGVALLGHITGATLGLAAGRGNLLRTKHNG